GLGSLVPAILFGVAIGNILRGIPIDKSGVFTGSFPDLLNPYALLLGVLSLAMFTMHGAAYMTLKTEGVLRESMQNWVSKAWIAFFVLYFLATLATFFVSPFLFEDSLSNPLFWILFLLLLAATLYIPIAAKAGECFRTFLASSVTIACMIGLIGVSLFPRLVPSTTNLAFSLTVYNASSTSKTLTVMLIIVLVGMPLVIGYTMYIYRVFKGKVVISEESY
ncbi:MAG: cytochrome d ubiquinol oxidase subunit II, partial [Candidatus Brocadiales bacterium]|nr:cytochrome d ubiquinol oxidase subunit II [Candidatus Brocadiales bacterium]